MVNVRETKQALENALIDQDPHRLAQVFALPVGGLLSSTICGGGGGGGEPRKHNPQSFMVEGKDCGSLLTSLLNATAAAEVVSNSCIVLYGLAWPGLCAS